MQQVWSRLYVLLSLAYVLWQKWFIKLVMHRSLLTGMMLAVMLAVIFLAPTGPVPWP